MFSSFLLFFLSPFIKYKYNKISTNIACDNFNELINASIYQSILEYSQIYNNTQDTHKLIQEYDFYNVTEHALKYGAYTRHLSSNNEDNIIKKKKN